MFSDRPALESASKLAVLKSNTLVQVTTPEGAVKAAPRPAIAAAGPVTPEVEAAMGAVMLQAESSRRLYPLCNLSQETARAFTQAASGWRERNLAPIEQQRKLLMLVISPAKRAELQEKVGLALNAELASVAARTGQERASWCAAAVAHMGNPTSDIHQPAMMAAALTPYKRSAGAAP